jgi:FG-GAP-like repeat/ASPIC and UnbV
MKRPFLSLAAPTLLAACLAASPAGAVPDFTEVVAFGEGATIAIGWADADNDGDLDMLVGNNSNQQNYLYRNDGGTFTEQSAFGRRSTFAIVAGDQDNDGDADVAVGNSGGNLNKLILNNGDGTFTGTDNLGSQTTIAMAWADYDLDGDLDMATGNGILINVRQNYLYRNDGGEVFTEIAEFGADKTASVAWGDFDGDGDPDLAVGNGGFGYIGQNYLYVNNGDGTFTAVPEFGMGDTASLVWGDADNDGDLDLAVANWNGGQNYLYRNDGGSFAELPRFGVRDPNTAAWGDFDNDGDLDLAVGNGNFGSADSNYLYINEGGLAFTESAQFGLGSTDGLAWGDFDNDGDLDMACGNEHTPATNYLYVNNENDADWLFVRPVGHFHDTGAGYSNRDAIGAKVAAYDAGFVGDPAHLLGFREIEAHGGFSAQNQIDAHFGLPGHATVDLRITWPGSDGSNLVQDVTGVAVPGRITVHEGVSSVDAPATSPAQGRTWLIRPNPMTDDATIRYLGARDPVLGMEILDVGGRLVRALPLLASGDGATARWNGRDAGGQRVAPGVYFVRAPGDAAAPGRVVVLH